MELEWQYVDHLSGFRLAIQRLLTNAGFHFVGAAYIQLTDTLKKRRVVVFRRHGDSPKDTVTVLTNQVFYRNGHLGLKLGFFSSALMIDEHGNLCISDGLRQAVLIFQ